MGKPTATCGRCRAPRNRPGICRACESAVAHQRDLADVSARRRRRDPFFEAVAMVTAATSESRHAAASLPLTILRLDTQYEQPALREELLSEELSRLTQAVFPERTKP